MKKYTKVIKRLTTQDCPLSFGNIAICFTENEDGKIFSDLIDEILTVNSIKKQKEKNDILLLKYLINVEITSEVTTEDVQDLRVGLAKLDKTSIDYRVSLATDDREKIKESARRSTANLHINGLFNILDFAQEFDLCNLDISNLSVEDVKKNMIFIAAIAQRPNPTTYTVSTELANLLDDENFHEDVIKKTFEAKIKAKSVFAKKQGLKNIFVRSL